MTSAKCRDGAVGQDKKTNATLKVLRTSETPRQFGLPVALVTYTTANRDGTLGYRARGFLATGDICGDLEFYSGKPISDDDADLKKVFLSFQLDPDYAPQFSDVARYAQVLFQAHEYRAAAPIFERALTMVPSDGASLVRQIIRTTLGLILEMLKR
jgi:hypothetical protein